MDFTAAIVAWVAINSLYNVDVQKMRVVRKPAIPAIGWIALNIWLLRFFLLGDAVVLDCAFSKKVWPGRCTL